MAALRRRTNVYDVLPLEGVNKRLGDLCAPPKYSDGSTGTVTIPDETFEEISRLLIHVEHHLQKSGWSDRPRTYAVLRMIDCIHAMPIFIASGLNDMSFPYTSRRSLDGLLKGYKDCQEFLNLQSCVLTDAYEIEKGFEGRHICLKKDGDELFASKRLIGQGGSGSVDRVLTKLSFREYARKRISRGKALKRNDVGLAQFERELSALKRLHHDHLVQVKGSYTDPKYVALIIEPIADCNLKEYLCRFGGIPNDDLPTFRTYFGCLARAVEYLHSEGIRHKDIKPENILLKADQILLSDFGTALDWRGSMNQSMTTGLTDRATSRYQSPEVAEHTDRRSSSDIWSLGVVFLEMTTVLRGKNLGAMEAFLEKNGTGNIHVYRNIQGAIRWFEVLQQSNKLPTSDNEPLAWIKEMIKKEPIDRPRADKLVQKILESSSDGTFCGLCCAEGSSTTQSDFSDNDPRSDEPRDIAMRGSSQSYHCLNQVDESVRAIHTEAPISYGLAAVLKPGETIRERLMDTFLESVSIGTYENEAPRYGEPVGPSYLSENVALAAGPEDCTVSSHDFTDPQPSQSEEGVPAFPGSFPMDSVAPATTTSNDLPQDLNKARLQTKSLAPTVDTSVHLDYSSIETGVGISRGPITQGHAADTENDTLLNYTQPQPDAATEAISNMTREEYKQIHQGGDSAGKLQDAQWDILWQSNPAFTPARASFDLDSEWESSSTIWGHERLSSQFNALPSPRAADEYPNEERPASSRTRDLEPGPSFDHNLTQTYVHQIRHVENELSKLALPKVDKSNGRSLSNLSDAGERSKRPRIATRSKQSLEKAKPKLVQGKEILGQIKFPDIESPHMVDASDTHSISQQLPTTNSEVQRAKEKEITQPIKTRSSTEATSLSYRDCEEELSSTMKQLTEANVKKEVDNRSARQQSVKRKSTPNPTNPSSPSRGEQQARVGAAPESKTHLGTGPANDDRIKSSKLKERLKNSNTPQPPSTTAVLTAANLNLLVSGTLPPVSVPSPSTIVERNHARVEISASQYMKKIFDDAASSAPTSVLSKGTMSRLSQGGPLLVWQDKTSGFLEGYTKSGKVAAVRILLDRGCNPGTVTQPRWGPIFNAVRGESERHTKCVRALIEHGVDVNARNPTSGKTPLHYAIEHQPWSGHTNMIYLLLAAGANPDLKDASGDVPLLQILSGNNEPLEKHRRDALALLLAKDYKTNVNVTPIGTLNKPLHLAVRRKDYWAVGMILEKGVPVSEPNGAGVTPLLLAANSWSQKISEDQLQILMLLLEKGAAVNDTTSHWKRTALHMAVSHHLDEAIELLLEHDADPSQKDKGGKSPHTLAQEIKAQAPKDRKCVRIANLISEARDRRKAERKTSDTRSNYRNERNPKRA
ncbi:MAG: hypothetical protein M1827_003938 [Pycnora praestabilis]|nr:MAG: hypothetical protein M1827_003938 [Pycnora praestabilis]